ncbi:MAG: PIN domain-containing protein [Betaproteobacteria bacterium]|nr:PIN domain-containing protein [Betaproteobacteria bacterium]
MPLVAPKSPLRAPHTVKQINKLAMPQANTLVLDCNCWLDLLVFADPSVAALEKLLEGNQADAISCLSMRDELIRVLNRPSISKRCNPLAVMLNYDRLARLHPDPPSQRLQIACADPDDQMFLDLALTAKAPYLISKDRQLLGLAKTCSTRFGLHILSQSSVRFQWLCERWVAEGESEIHRPRLAPLGEATEHD